MTNPAVAISNKHIICVTQLRASFRTCGYIDQRVGTATGLSLGLCLPSFPIGFPTRGDCSGHLAASGLAIPAEESSTPFKGPPENAPVLRSSKRVCMTLPEPGTGLTFYVRPLPQTEQRGRISKIRESRRQAGQGRTFILCVRRVTTNGFGLRGSNPGCYLLSV